MKRKSLKPSTDYKETGRKPASNKWKNEHYIEAKHVVMQEIRCNQLESLVEE